MRGTRARRWGRDFFLPIVFCDILGRKGGHYTLGFSPTHFRHQRVSVLSQFVVLGAHLS